MAQKGDGMAREVYRYHLGDVDMHTHTTASDGRLSPRALVQRAHEVGLRAVGIADHDTFGGIEEALQAGQDLGVEVIPAIELSCEADGHDLHLLGYYMDHTHPDLLARLAYFRDIRERRAYLMVEKLRDLGYPIAWERVQEIAGDADAIGRPHIAQALLEAGYVQSWEEAFDRLIGDGGPAYVPKAKMTPREAIELVLEYGGVPVIAHPGLNTTPEYVEQMIAWGLRGIEVYHPRHSPEEVARYRDLAQRHGLVITGGSDFHGIAEEIGDRDEHGNIGDVRVPYAFVEALKEVAASLS